jgi:hypothetical protein
MAAHDSNASPVIKARAEAEPQSFMSNSSNWLSRCDPDLPSPLDVGKRRFLHIDCGIGRLKLRTGFRTGQFGAGD